MEMTLRCEIFPDDLGAVVDFYSRVLRFEITKDQRDLPAAYVALRRGNVLIGALRGEATGARAARLPPRGVAAGWPIADDLRDRPWGLTDFRIIDPAGYYLRITDRA